MQHKIGRDALCLCLKINNQPVTQCWQRNLGHIIKAHVEAAFRQCPNFSPKQQGLGTARAAAKLKKLIGDFLRRLCVWVRGKNEPNRIVFHMRGDRHLLNKLL